MSTSLRVQRSTSLEGAVGVPGDKSITHRAVILGALAEGRSRIRKFLAGSDCLATVEVIRALGVKIEQTSSDELVVRGCGLHGWKPPAGSLDCVNSGTTMRLMAGTLAAQTFSSRLTGSDQLRRRPMSRIIEPLRAMGAEINDHDGKPPLDIRDQQGGLHGIDYQMPVASAQLKSCLLLAGLWAEGSTAVVEDCKTRDHTERMLGAMGSEITVDRGCISVDRQRRPLQPLDMTIPGDLSSAAFFIVAATIVPGSELTLPGVGVNPTRTGIIDALIEMGADIALDNERVSGGEPVADITVRYASLRGAKFDGDRIVTMIDELPVLAVAATQASGTTIIRDAAELRVKETDRIAATAVELGRLGGRVTTLEDGLIIEGGAPLQGTAVDSHGDHRLAMALAIAGLVARGETLINDTGVASDSFPGFCECLASCGATVEVL